MPSVKRAALADIDPNAQRCKKKPRQGPTDGDLGRKKPLQERHCRRDVNKPIKRYTQSYRRERVIEVLIWLATKRIPITLPPCGQQPTRWRGVADGTRLPTFQEAAAHFGGSKQMLPWETVRNWWNRRDAILEMKQGAFRVALAHNESWPGLEQELFERFVKWRLSGKAASKSWFRRTSAKIVKSLAEDLVKAFKYSDGWLLRFCKRFGIGRRRVTRVAQKRPNDYIDVSNSFIKFCRRALVGFDRARLEDQWIKTCNPACLGRLLQPPCRRIQPCNILNFDETPVPFEFLDGYTYDLIGAKTVSVESKRSGWHKRQATLVLYIFADGVPRLKPKLIFHGAADQDRNRLRKEEASLYSDKVTVEYNEAAYNNGQLMLKWAIEELVPTLRQQESLLVMDHASFHKTEDVMKVFRANCITPCMIPAGCTAILQPLDVSINKAFKEKMRELLDEHLERAEEENQPMETPSARRVLLTKVVGEAWDWLCTERVEMVKNSFISTGINIAVDGSEDHLIDIKDIKQESIDVSHWHQQDVVVKTEAIAEQDEFEVLDTFNEDIAGQFRGTTVKKLKQLLKDRSLPSSGSKEELVQRLAGYERVKIKEKLEQELMESGKGLDDDTIENSDEVVEIFEV